MKEEVKLRQTLTLFQVVFLGLAWMTPMIYFTVYGIAYDTSRGMLTVAYLIAVIAIFFTARSYGVMARTYPASGSAYTYAGKSLHPYVGFLVGWALLLDYLFSPIIACLTFGIYLHAQFPSVPTFVWIVLLNAALAVVNIIGINFSAIISKLFVLLQLTFIAVFCFFLIKGLAGAEAIHPLQPFVHAGIPFSTILAGASIICFSFLGFDTITTMAEETVDARRTIPRAILIIIIAAGVMYLIPSYLTQLAYPQLSFVNLDSAGFELVRMVGGAGLSALFITILILAIFTQGLTSITSVSRLLYVMGRDSILPKRIFGYLHPRFKTPTRNIIITSVISLLALTISLDAAVKFVSFGALTAFVFVNLSVIAKRYLKDNQRSLKQTLLYLVSPLLGAGFIIYLLFQLDRNALLAGSLWMLLGIVYHLYRTRTSQAAGERLKPRPAETQI
ncbi:APC family permease [Paenibacillus sepulcri]|uniref:APC family permease n=1 Tax=Paenibacillus sepulcri TaxID=359917 RepID=A0ABS7C783_9BACL|nr:APC family permease [Paenibacillus sepulcri]